MESTWWSDFTGLLGAGKDFLKDNISADGLKGVSAVAGAIGQFQSNKESKRQFDEMMDIKLDEYNRQVKRQETNDANLATGFANSTYGTSL